MALKDINLDINIECSNSIKGEFSLYIPKDAYWEGDALVWDNTRLSFYNISEEMKRKLVEMLKTMESDYLEIKI